MRTNFTMGSTSLKGSRSRTPVELMMTPMIDVVFLLLVFFLATSSFQMVEKMLPSGVAEEAPQTSASMDNSAEINPTDDLGDIVVRLKASPQGNYVYEVNGDALDSLQQLNDRLIAIIAIKKDVPVIVDPDETIPIGEAIVIYDAARSAGAIRVFFATRSTP